MIRDAHGNLLADDADALVNTVNTEGVMGKGIALQFKRAYPEMHKAYARAAKAGEIVPGRMHVWATGAMTGPRYVINFPTKRHWRSPSRMQDVESGLVDLVRVVRDLEITSIAVPPLGCGNGGLDWREVEPRIQRAFAELSDEVDVRVYPPEGAPAAREMVNNTSPPAVTPTRAALLALMVTYQRLSWEWPTPLVVQKLAYFLQSGGRSMRLDFAKHWYGPYDDNLRKTLRDLEGHYVVGFGDGSARPLDADGLEVTDAGFAAADSVLKADPDAADDFERVAHLVSGFESPSDLELLATVHWVATHEGVHTPEEAGAAIRDWTSRKATMFTQHHITVAWQALEEGGWLTPAPAAAR